MDEPKVYKFESSDNEIYEMTTEEIDQSITLCNVVLINNRRPIPEDPIPIKRVSGDVFKRIVKWLQMHRIDQQSTSTWPEDYLKSLSEDQFNKFMSAAEYLIIESVLFTAKKEMMRRMKIKKPAEYKRTFEMEKVTIGRNLADDTMVMTISRRV